jgi:D-3-phosphoglycerate dehydrogenase
MRLVFVDATDALGAVAARVAAHEPISLKINYDPYVRPEAVPGVLNGAEIALIDHTRLPIEVARQCNGLRHVVFLGTGASFYMDPEALAAEGIEVHTISRYSNTAVAEMSVALMWAASKRIAFMDRELRRGQWLRTEGIQLTGKTLGLIGFGGIAQEVARLASWMHVLAWNRTPRQCLGVEFVTLEELLRTSDVVSMHLLLSDETRGFLSPERLAQMRSGAMLINTARGPLVDEAAMIARLRSGELGAAGLDVFALEPLPANHELTSLDNVTLTAHSGFVRLRPIKRCWFVRLRLCVDCKKALEKLDKIVHGA